MNIVDSAFRRRGMMASVAFMLALLAVTGISAAEARTIAIQSDRWVATVGIDTGNDCATQTNPCATISHAIAQASAGDAVHVGNGTYTEPVTVSKSSLKLIGSGNGTGGTVLTSTLNISASGTAADRLQIDSLRISGAAGDGIRINTASHLSFLNLVITGSAGNGFEFHGDASDVIIDDSLVDGNTVGLRTSSTSNVSSVTITDTIFSHSSRVGLLLFGAAQGSGSINNWTIDGSAFEFNDNSDNPGNGFGGGIHLVSYGGGSVVDGFTVTNSTFADNGVKPDNQYKRGGIVVNASGDGVLRNVVICGNSFSETSVPGTQANGITVYDGTDNSGYVPIEVCASNNFAGGDHSITGQQQFDEFGTQPVVNITGGTIVSLNHVNQPVKNLDTGETFPTITRAINDADTDDGDTMQVPVGLYVEDVILSKALTVTGPNVGVAGASLARQAEATMLGTIQIRSPDVSIDGMRMGDETLAKLLIHNGNSQNFVFANNVVENLTGTFLQISNSVDWSFTNNLFRNISKYTLRLHGGTPKGVLIQGNTFDDVHVAAQIIGNETARITGNRVINAAAGASYAFQIANSSDVTFTDNTVLDRELGLLLDHNDANLELTCNNIDVSSYALVVADNIAAGNDAMRVMHNRFAAPNHLYTYWQSGQILTLGSNYYDGAPVTAQTAGALVQLADPLPANPISNAQCGNNAPAEIVVYSGDKQHALITGAFGSPLVARVQDTLGGAVMGEPVMFTAPTSGASANLASPSGNSNYNGEFSSTAVANASAGSYTALAVSGSLTPGAGFTLHNERAAASITLDQASLNAVYDGNSHAVSASTNPANLSYSLSYDGNSAAPVNAGNYTVVATITDPSYVASGGGTLTIAKAPALVFLSDLEQTWDGSPKPVAASTSPSGLTVDMTYDGNSVAPSAAGGYAIVATINDPNYSGSASGVLHITEAPRTDLEVSMTDGREYVQYGRVLSYAIVVSNVGNQPVTGATLNTVLPQSLLPIMPVTWRCYSNVGGSCGSISGKGDLSTTVNLQVNGSVTIILDSLVNDDLNLPSDQIHKQVTVSHPDDSNPANDTAIDTTQVVIYRDGQESGSDGAQVPMLAGGLGGAISLDSSNGLILGLQGAWIKSGGIVELAHLRSGDDQIRIEALHVGKQLLVRMVGNAHDSHQLSAWTEVDAGTQRLAVAIAASGDQRTLLLIGGIQDLQLKLSDGADTILIWGPQDAEK